MAGHSAAPLFPRLHVSDTEKQGPKAPPRNKMALYEQFTIASHGSLHLTPASTAIPYQQQQKQQQQQQQQQQYASNMYQYPYLSYYVPSSVQPASGNQYFHLYAQPSIAASSIVMSNSSYVLNDDESQRSSDHKIVGDSGRSDAPRTANNCKLGSKAKGILNQRIKISETSSETMETSNVVPQNFSQTQQLESVASPDITETIDGLLEVVNTVQVGSSQPKPYKNDFGIRVNLDEVVELDQNTTANENVTKRRVRKAIDHQKKDDLLLPEKSCQQFVYMDNRCEHESKVESESLRETKSKPGQARLQSQSEHKHDQTSIAVADCYETPVQAFMPKDVMRQMGQQLFWKARKALLRQQQVFSDQVFELHKLTRVQQLLAKIPGTLLDEPAQLGAVDNDVAPAVWDVTKGEKKNKSTSRKGNEGAEAVASLVSGQSIREESHSLKNVDVEARNSTVHAIINEDVQLKSNVQMVGAVSWGYPKMGAGQWTDPHGHPLIFWNFAGTLSPGFSYGRFFGLPMMGTMPPIMPIGIPVCRSRQETTESKMPCAISNQNLDSSATSRNLSHGHPQLTGPLYHLSQKSSNNNKNNNLCYNQRSVDNSTTKQALQGSRASTSSKLEESMKSSSTPGVELQWSLKAGTDKSQVSERHNDNASTCFNGLEHVIRCNMNNGQFGVGGGHRMVENANDVLNLFSMKPTSVIEPAEERRGQVIKVVPRSAGAASHSTAGILLSLQQERQK